jgi:energy-coupling factor transporter ATP-binding protein EcfA2
MSKNKLLVIGGASGSGKSTLERNLIEAYPDLFHKLQQATTRKKRVGERDGDPYIFLQPSGFDHIQDKLIGRLGVRPNSLFKDRYGSFPDFVEGKVSTIILAEEALYDLRESIAIGVIDAEVYVLGLDVAYEDLAADAKREGRDESFLEKERSFLKLANTVYRNTNGKYIQPKTVVALLQDHFFLD